MAEIRFSDRKNKWETQMGTRAAGEKKQQILSTQHSSVFFNF